jgi:long-chain fatty acid transport protein
MTITTAGSAVAAGFAIGTQNASGLGNAYAGAAAAAEDASTIWYNPAGLTNIPGRQVVGALNVIKTSVEFTNSASTAPPGFAASLANSGGDAGDWAAIPTGYLSWQLNPELWLGLGVGVPFGLKTEWDDGWVGQFWATTSEVKTVNINPTIAWKINPSVSLGLGLNAQWLDAELSRRVFLGVGTSTLSTVSGDDWGWGWNLGAMFTLSPTTRIGVSYRSEIDYTIEGNVTFSPQAGPAVNGPIRADIKLPWMASVALSQKIGPQWEILWDFTYTGWDSIQDLTIFRTSGTLLSSEPLRFDNSWRSGIGVNYQLNPQWKLRFGTAYDKTPVQDQFRSPRLPDEDRVWLAVGAQWAFSKQGALDFGYAHEFVSDASSNLTSPAAPDLRGNLSGTYKSSVDIFGIQLRYSF